MVITSTRKKSRFLPVFIGSMVASVLLFFAIGYIVGSSNVGIGQLNDTQNRFVAGVAAGGGFSNDYMTWKMLPDKNKSMKDVRAFPETRCASQYYPQDPIAMSGCLQGINPPPDSKYFIPEIDG